MTLQVILNVLLVCSVLHLNTENAVNKTYQSAQVYYDKVINTTLINLVDFANNQNSFDKILLTFINTSKSGT